MTTTWIDQPIVGSFVRLRSSGRGYVATKSGIYLGVFTNEDDGAPCHYFIHGEINGIAQSCFGFPAERGTKITDDRTPTAAITAALAAPRTVIDNRPRVLYVLPDGSDAPIIFDHDEIAPPTVTFTLIGGQVISIKKKAP